MSNKKTRQVILMLSPVESQVFSFDKLPKINRLSKMVSYVENLETIININPKV